MKRHVHGEVIEIKFKLAPFMTILLEPVRIKPASVRGRLLESQDVFQMISPAEDAHTVRAETPQTKMESVSNVVPLRSSSGHQAAGLQRRQHRQPAGAVGTSLRRPGLLPRPAGPRQQRHQERERGGRRHQHQLPRSETRSSLQGGVNHRQSRTDLQTDCRRGAHR